MRFVPQNLGLKVLAVVLALLLWVHVVTNNEYEHTVELPLIITGIQDDLMLVSYPPETCEVKVRGVGKQLLRFLVETEEVAIDASSYSTGLYMADVTPADLIAEFSSIIDIAEVIRPKKLRLQFEEEVTKTVKIVPEVEVVPALGYIKVESISVDPESVVVSGPKRVVRQMKLIETEELTYTDVTESLSESIRLSFPDSSFLTLSDSSVEVRQTIIELKERTFTGIPIAVRNADSHPTYTMTPESVSVTVEAVPEILDSLNADQFAASVDLSTAVPGSTFVSPRITFPTTLRLVDVRPKEILVEVPAE